MATGFYLVQGDKTTCGGRIIEGATDHTIFGKAAAREKDRVLCGKHPGTFLIAGGIVSDTIHGRRMAGTLDSESTCPCKAKFIPSMLQDTYEKASRGSAAASKSSASNPVARPLPAYLTGEKPPSGFVPDYPVLRNTYRLPDNALREMLEANRHDYMLLTLDECIEIISSWDFYKNTWVDITTSKVGGVAKLYATNIGDIISASKVVSQLGSMGIKCSVYINHKGTELIKLTGYPGIRKILNAPVFSLKNPQIIKFGIGKYGLQNSIKSGAIVGLVYVSVVNTIDFILNDEVTLSKFIGTLATDFVKVGISSAVVFGVGIPANMFIPFVIGPIVVVVAAGLGTAMILNYLDDKYGVTSKITLYIESAQQEFVLKAREIDKGLLDLGAMYADGMLKRGREVLELEIKRYIRNQLDEIGIRNWM
ncbi:PAAR domain-containing protein [Rahnella sp. SAP-1]|uniref:PAAR domain-containing protein n=1 Tax=Rouxiella aceris TaxID=2703884 RepID=A0A848MHH6_9GAMM|nr:PAAR domain-containing protein [Rouxiella aceris]NMP26623.1 PAAR domain-containing protein [Rouxiella aceris]